MFKEFVSSSIYLSGSPTATPTTAWSDGEPRGSAEAKTETLGNNQNWFLLDQDTENTGIPATTFRKKAGRIFFHFHFHFSLYE